LPIAVAWSPLEGANHWFAITVERDWREITGKNARTLCNDIGESLFRMKAVKHRHQNTALSPEVHDRPCR